MKLQMEQAANPSSANMVCKFCTFVFYSDSSGTLYRCGIDYYLQPPVARKQGRMDSYPEVSEAMSCEKWKLKI